MVAPYGDKYTNWESKITQIHTGEIQVVQKQHLIWCSIRSWLWCDPLAGDTLWLPFLARLVSPLYETFLLWIDPKSIRITFLCFRTEIRPHKNTWDVAAWARHVPKIDPSQVLTSCKLLSLVRTSVRLVHRYTSVVWIRAPGFNLQRSHTLDLI